MVALQGGVGPGDSLEQWLRWSAHPLSGVVCRGHVQYLAFPPSSLEVEVGVLVCLYLVGFPKSTYQCIPVQSLGWEDLLEKGMATHFSILA